MIFQHVPFLFRRHANIHEHTNELSCTYIILLTKILASNTQREVGSPFGFVHDLPVTEELRNIHGPHGGAHTSTPPGRVFHTSLEFSYEQLVKSQDTS